MAISLKEVIKQHRRGEQYVTPPMRKWLAYNSDIPMTPEMKAFFNSLLEDQDSNNSREGRFGASSRGKCYRAQVFRYLGTDMKDMDPDVSLNAIYLDGKFRHLRWQLQMMAAGIITGAEYKAEVPSLRLGTSIDAVNETDLVAIEIKGMQNTGKANSIKAIEEEYPGHMLQMHSMIIAAPWIERFSYIADSKAYQSWEEVVLRPQQRWLDEVMFELDALNQAVDKKKLPPVLEECRSGRGKTFISCPYSHVCLGCSWERANERKAQAVELGATRRKGRKKLRAHHQGPDSQA